jgi:hypothetical protein
MDLKIKIIGYDVLKAKPSEIEAAVNYFMAAVNVKEVQVVTVLSSVILHILYEGDEPEYDAKPEGQ